MWTMPFNANPDQLLAHLREARLEGDIASVQFRGEISASGESHWELILPVLTNPAVYGALEISTLVKEHAVRFTHGYEVAGSIANLIDAPHLDTSIGRGEAYRLAQAFVAELSRGDIPGVHAYAMRGEWCKWSDDEAEALLVYHRLESWLLAIREYWTVYS